MQQDEPQFDTPILFLIFNRPDLTEQVFGQIRKIRPKQLFIGADGPRKDKAGENEKCEVTRKLVLDMIDWDCEVKTLFREENLGCGLAVSQAIAWFFEHVEMGIILEDDCYPDLTFFPFCSELLDYYRNDEKVMHINGSNFQFGKKRGDASYYFSKYPNVWGWATWKRSWKYYKHSVNDKTQNQPKKIFDKKEILYWQKILISVQNKRVDSWGYRWNFAIFKEEGHVVVANKNLIINIGYGNQPTHTGHKGEKFKKMKLESMPLPIIHTEIVIDNEKADKRTFALMTKNTTTIQNSIRNLLYSVIPDTIYKDLKARYYKLLKC